MEVKSLSNDLAINSFYMIFCTGLLFFVIIGISMFYSGLTQRRSSFLQLSLPTLLFPFIIIEWYIWGYSLCYSSSNNEFIGNLSFAVLRHLKQDATMVYSTPRGEILSIIHFFFNGMFKVICVSFTFPGCLGERARLLPMLLFLFIWCTIIYNPVTYWFWNRNGWLSAQLDKFPVLDFAGGNCIHIISGFTALAYSYILGPRNSKLLYNYKSSNNAMILIGSFFVNFGWLGFISGCDFKFSTFSIFIMVNTVLCSCVSGLVWISIDYYYSAIPLENDPNGHKYERRKLSIVSLCSGMMVGLVVITPAGGFISTPSGFWKSIVFGIIGGAVGNLSTRLKFFFNIDDSFDIFAIHGVTGWVGSLLTGVFAEDSYGSEGGWVTGHFIQICYQLLGCTVTSVYVFVMSIVFLYLIDLIPGCHLRIDKDFNKRMRQAKIDSQNKRLQLESSLSPTNIRDRSYADDNFDSFEQQNEFEDLELNGGDQYELNGEYFMDFMEFIKVVRPEDFIDEISGKMPDLDQPYVLDMSQQSPPGEMVADSEGSKNFHMKQE